MNFFAAQARAKKETSLLVVLFVAAVIALIAVTYLFVLVIWAYVDTQNLQSAWVRLGSYATFQTLLVTSSLVLGTVGFGIVSMYWALSKGGESVAVALGGTKLLPQSDDPKHQQLYHVVEEMSLASGIAVPSVFILNDTALNAFAAGFTSDDAAIGVTQGLLDTLDRNELQGVIAHEFSHIFNGDMRLNMQLTSLLNGILSIGNLGSTLLRSAFRSGGGSRTKDKNGNSGLLILGALGLGLLAIGYVGVLIGTLIKARISRNREYLADATAVQYTRYPAGIAGALKKIKRHHSKLQAKQASTFSHLFFANGVSGWIAGLFATHPPLDKRIKAIEPAWDGTIREGGIPQIDLTQPPKQEQFTKATAIIGNIGQIYDTQIAFAHHFLARLDTKLTAQLHTALGAQAVVLSLLSDDRMMMRNRQWELVEGVLKKELAYTHILLKSLHRHDAIHLVQLALPALKQSTLNQYKTFKLLIAHFIEMDTKLTLFEWSMQHIVIRPLDVHFNLAKPPVLIHRHLERIASECELLLSLLAQLQSSSDEQAQTYFHQAAASIKAATLRYMPKSRIHITNFGSAMQAIEKAQPHLKEQIFKAALFIIDCDAKRTAQEIELIHALATLMQLPLGPLVTDGAL